MWTVFTKPWPETRSFQSRSMNPPPHWVSTCSIYICISPNLTMPDILITTIHWGRASFSSPHHHWNYISTASWKSSDPGKSYLATKFAFPQVPSNSPLLPLRAKPLLCRSHPEAGFVLLNGRLIYARRIERKYYFRYRDHGEKPRPKDLVLIHSN